MPNSVGRQVHKVILHNSCESPEDILIFSFEKLGIQCDDVVKIQSIGDSTKCLYVKVKREALDQEMTSIKNFISLNSEMAVEFGLKYGESVEISRVEASSVSLDSTEFHIEQQYVQRSDQWLVMKRLIGCSMYRGKKIVLSKPMVCIQSHELVSKDFPVKSGIITEKTNVVFRTKGTRVQILIQMSQEMWQYHPSGQMYFEIAIDGFLQELFSNWKNQNCRHELSVYFFSRNIYLVPNDGSSHPFCASLKKSPNGFYYKDFIKTILYRTHITDWVSLALPIKRHFIVYKNLIRDTSPFKYFNSSYKHGNLLETINFMLNNLAHTSTSDHVSVDMTARMMLVLSPGSGVFETNKQLAEITQKRVLETENDIDMISFGLQPLHVVPLIYYPQKPHNEYYSFRPISFSARQNRFLFLPWLCHGFYRPKTVSNVATQPLIQTGYPSILDENERMISDYSNYPLDRPFLTGSQQFHPTYHQTISQSSINCSDSLFEALKCVISITDPILKCIRTSNKIIQSYIQRWWGVLISPNRDFMMEMAKNYHFLIDANYEKFISDLMRKFEDPVPINQFLSEDPDNLLPESVKKILSEKSQDLIMRPVSLLRSMNLIEENDVMLEEKIHEMFGNIYWPSLSKPARLPIVNEFDEIHSLNNQPASLMYSIAVNDEESTSKTTRLKSSRSIFSELIAYRLNLGFQFHVTSTNKTSPFTEMEFDGSKSDLMIKHVMIKSSSVHHIRLTEKEIQVEIYNLFSESSCGNYSYECIFFPSRSHDYVQCDCIFAHSGPEKLEWSQIDYFLAGEFAIQLQKLPTHLNYYSLKTIVIPGPKLNSMVKAIICATGDEKLSLKNMSLNLHDPYYKEIINFLRSVSSIRRNLMIFDTPSDLSCLEKSPLPFDSCLTEIFKAFKEEIKTIRASSLDHPHFPDLTFLAYDSVSWVMSRVAGCTCRMQASCILQEMLENSLILSVNGNSIFLDGFHFYFIVLADALNASKVSKQDGYHFRDRNFLGYFPVSLCNGLYPHPCLYEEENQTSKMDHPNCLHSPHDAVKIRQYANRLKSWKSSKSVRDWCYFSCKFGYYIAPHQYMWQDHLTVIWDSMISPYFSFSLDLLSCTANRNMVSDLILNLMDVSSSIQLSVFAITLHSPYEYKLGLHKAKFHLHPDHFVVPLNWLIENTPEVTGNSDEFWFDVYIRIYIAMDHILRMFDFHPTFSPGFSQSYRDVFVNNLKNADASEKIPDLGYVHTSGCVLLSVVVPLPDHLKALDKELQIYHMPNIAYQVLKNSFGKDHHSVSCQFQFTELRDFISSESRFRSYFSQYFERAQYL